MIAVGNAPVIMMNGSFATCGSTFLDPGGTGNYSSGYYTTTVRPAIKGNNLRIVFSQFNLNYQDYLYIYDGPSTSSPLLGSYSAGMPPVFQSTAPGGELTFVFNSYSANGLSGWQAYINCFKPVLKPTGLRTISNISNNIKLTWKDNAKDEKMYTVERSENAPSLYKQIAQLKSNTTTYTDSTAPANSLLYYRVRAYRDTIGSAYSDTAIVALGKAPYLMKDSTLITCDKVFMDPGGVDIIRFSNYNNVVTTFKPAIAGNNIKVVFSSFSLNSALYVYDGPSTASPLIGSYYGYYPSLSVAATGAADGSLTFKYSGYSYGDSGWVAKVSCFKPVLKPTNFKAISDTSRFIKLTWKDNATDETQYVLERSVNASLKYTVLAQLSPNTNAYTDSTAPANSLLYYRVRAYRDTAKSLYSDTAMVAFGNAPYLMKDSTLITCDKVFMDQAGVDIIPSNIYNNIVTTFRAAITGNNIKIVFSTFRLNGALYVYDGPSTASPLIGVYNSYNPPLSVAATGADGSLTFKYSGYSYGDSGWVAKVSCFKPVLKPTGLHAISDTLNYIRLSWKDNAKDEKMYTVERSDNAPSMYKQVAQLKSNVTTYTDSTAPANSLLYYRVRAYRDTAKSFYSDTAIVALGNAPYLMRDSTLITCDKVFMDPGGVDVISYDTYNNVVTTFKPAVAGNNIKVIFNTFKLNGNFYVYDGPSTASPLIGSYNGYNPPLSVAATGADGSLTFKYEGYGDSGWVAEVSCFKPVLKPTGLKGISDTSNYIKLTWKDNAKDEKMYTVERSDNAPWLYKQIAQLKSNTTKYTDSTAPANSILYYRVRAYRDTAKSYYSDTALVAFGNAPYLMKDSTVVTCDKVFMDPAGVDIIPYDTYSDIITTFKPAIAGNNIKVVFSKFRLNGEFNVYDGPSTASPLIDSYNGYNRPLSVAATGADGSLTFKYRGYSYGDSGWVAQVSCFKPVLKPTGLTAISDTSQFIKLTWNDNANDETRYVIERSVNAPSKYTVLAQLTPNTNAYTDSTAPANSLLHYRVRAYRDTAKSFYSDTAIVAFGNAPYIMKDSTVITCDKEFLDPAGVDKLPIGTLYNVVTTFKAAIAGNNIKVVFSKFSLNGDLYVYDGPSTASPLIGKYQGYYSSLSVAATGADGSLTFKYNGSSYGEAGWVAKVSCFKPVLKPTGLTAISDTLNYIRLSWKDNAGDEKRYTVERSVNAPSMYKQIAQLKFNATTYTDSTAPANSLLYYRVRAYRDTAKSFYSDTALVALGNAPYLMKDSILITCDKVFMDPAGVDIIPYHPYNNIVTTFKPAIAGNKIKVVFSSFRLYGAFFIYDGPSTASPLIGSYNEYNPPLSVDATGADGSLTFYYESSEGYGDSGWVAKVSCFQPVLKPTNLKAISNTSRSIKLTWKDNAKDEKMYTVERSDNATSIYKQIAQLKSNTTTYTDSTAPANSLLYYRVRAYRDTIGSFYSDTALVAFGNAPYFMKDSTLITCDKVFMDPAGVDIIPSNIYNDILTTFKPAIAGNNIKVVFSKFNLNGNFYVYDGPSAASPLIGSYNTYNPPLSVTATGADGSLTFNYIGYSYGDSGWVAKVSCFKPVLKPTGLTAISDTSRFIKLAWKDNANDEKMYTVERSDNAPSMYKQVAQLKSNATTYTDSTAPANSLLYYRVRAYRDTAKSFYSDTAIVAFGNAPYLMKRDTTVITCDKVFMDAGGTDVIPSDIYYSSLTTFKAAVKGNNVRVLFSEFNTTYYTMYVYNGPTTSSPLLGSYSGRHSSLSFTGTGSDGSLTFYYEGYGGYGDSGWVAKVSCFKPVLKPTNFKAVSDSSQLIQLTWKDNATDETRYVLERSVNAPSKYTILAQLTPNTYTYTDSTASANSLLFYRIRACRDTSVSLYSNISIALGNAPFLMKNSTMITCNKMFLDPAGVDVISADNFADNADDYRRVIFKPAIAGNKIRVVFSKFNLKGSLTVYDGPSERYRRIGNYSGNYSSLTFDATGADGSLTFEYTYYGSRYFGDSGWVAQVSCYKPVSAPGGLTGEADTLQQMVKLNWNDNADDETKYVVERSVNSSAKYIIVARLNANSNKYTDSSAPANTLLYYRVKAYRDTSQSLYSAPAKVSLGNSPFFMKNSTLITCDKIFFSPLSLNSSAASDYYRTVATFKPSENGNNVKVTFSKFNTDGILYVYNGSSMASPYIGGYSGYYPSLSFQATGTDGSLTFYFTGYSNGDSSWIAQVSCIKTDSIASFAGNNNVYDVSSQTKNLTHKWQQYKGIPYAGIAKLSQNSPNPFKRKTVIPYNIPESSGAAMIIIYTIDGKAIKTFGNLSKGSNRIEILANTFAAGTYIYTLLVDGKPVQSRRMIITK